MSKVLNEAEVRYPRLQKLIYSLIIVVKQLQPYFQAHSIIVLTDQPLKVILMSPNTFGQVAKWAIRLGEFDISFHPRSALKAQVIADFIVECTWGLTPMIKHLADSSHGEDISVANDVKDIDHV